MPPVDAAPRLDPAGVSLDTALAGLDALETPTAERPPWTRRAWAVLWPKLAAVGLLGAVWWLVYHAHWKPDYVIPSPAEVASTLATKITAPEFWHAVATTMRRALTGFALAVVVGTVLGLLVSRIRPLRTAVGALITGLQTMPSIVWFPFAILLFGLSEASILFVVVIGAAPSIANGLVGGVDYVPPLLLRAGRVLGARGMTLYRHVILPASLPAYVGGLKQGWAFAWRSLMAGELLVIIAKQPSIGAELDAARQLADAPSLIAMMIVVLVIGIVVDGVFGAADRAIRRRWGLLDGAG